MHFFSQGQIYYACILAQLEQIITHQHVGAQLYCNKNTDKNKIEKGLI